MNSKFKILLFCKSANLNKVYIHYTCTVPIMPKYSAWAQIQVAQNSAYLHTINYFGTGQSWSLSKKYKSILAEMLSTPVALAFTANFVRKDNRY